MAKYLIGNVSGAKSFNQLTDKPTTISGYGITDAYTKTEVDNKVSAVYKPGGTLAASGIVAGLLVKANDGKVYNISEDFTTTSDFAEGSGKTYPAGTNIVVFESSTNVYKFDVLAGTYGNATQSGSGLMSAADKTKLDGVATGAEVNVLEGITVNGTDATISSKKVSLTNVDGLSLSNGTLAITANGTTVGSVSLPSSGTSDYADLTNKPSINSVTLSGNKSSSDLGLVAAEQGKGLSTNDFTTTLKDKLDGIDSGAEVNVLEGVTVNGTDATISSKKVAITNVDGISLSNGTLSITANGTTVDSVSLPSTSTIDFSNVTNTPTTLSGYGITDAVQAVSGKGLSSNDYTTAEKNKLADIASGAEVNVLEGVTVNGTDATISSKKVSLTIPDDLTIITQNDDKILQLKADSTVVDSVTLPKGGGHAITDGTTDYTNRPKLQFDGAIITDDSTNDKTIVSAGHVIKDGTTTFTQRRNLKITGATITDDSSNDATVVAVGGTDYSVSIATSDWTQVSGQSYYSATKTVSGITASDTPIIDIVPTLAGYEGELEDWAKLIKAETAANSVVFYASEAFTNAVSVLVKVV